MEAKKVDRNVNAVNKAKMATENINRAENFQKLFKKVMDLVEEHKIVPEELYMLASHLSFTAMHAHIGNMGKMPEMVKKN